MKSINVRNKYWYPKNAFDPKDPRIENKTLFVVLNDLAAKDGKVDLSQVVGLVEGYGVTDYGTWKRHTSAEVIWKKLNTPLAALVPEKVDKLYPIGIGTLGSIDDRMGPYHIKDDYKLICFSLGLK